MNYNKSEIDCFILYPQINQLNDEMKEQRKINFLFKRAIKKELKKKRAKDFLFVNNLFIAKNKNSLYLIHE